jgi:translation initiation factor IF-2
MSVRIYQLAKQLGIENRQVIRLLCERGLDVKSPSNTIPSIYADALVEEIGGKQLPPAAIDGQTTDPKGPISGETLGKTEVPKLTAVPTPKIVANEDVTAMDRHGGVVAENVSVPRPIGEKIEPRQPPHPRLTGGKPERRKPLMVSIGSLDSTKKQPDDGPEVRLPELPKRPPVDAPPPVEEERPEEIRFKPFLKKIERQTTKVADLRVVTIRPPIIVRTLATQMNIKPFQLISKLMSMNIFASMNQEIDLAVAQGVAEKFGYQLELARVEPEMVARPKAQPKKQVPTGEKGHNFLERPPVVCVLGHVDHGKTTLLDTIRHARVAAGEAGGITQHVAAYQIERNGKKITFIDTPGHAAFSKMRQRGADVTDIGVLVVAADDGFMPQTDEALKFARKANIPTVIAINKIDAKGANIDRVKQQMQQRGITPEDWGGETLCAAISALNGTNVENLLELILLQAEIMELRADAAGHPEGVVLEAKIVTGHGVLVSAIVQDGTLKVGDCLICGSSYCKVKSIIDDNGRPMKVAPASTPVDIIGWSSAPEIGAKFTFVENEKAARRLAEEGELEAKKTKGPTGKDDAEISNIDQLFSAIAAVDDKVLNVILRADVHGSAEALNDSLKTIDSQKIRLNILDCGVGAVNKNDVAMANTAGAQIVAFNARAEPGAQALAKQLGVKITQHNIIYEIVDMVREAMAECLDPELHENKLGAAEVRQIFKIKGDTIAGCMVTEGKILRDKFVRLVRKKNILFQGKFASLRRQKEDVPEARAGFECGIIIAGFDACEIGDVLECFEIKKVQPAL